MHNQPNGLCRTSRQGPHISDICVLFHVEEDHPVHIELRQGQLCMVDQKVEVDAVVQPNQMKDREQLFVRLVLCTALAATYSKSTNTV